MASDAGRPLLNRGTARRALRSLAFKRRSPTHGRGRRDLAGRPVLVQSLL